MTHTLSDIAAFLEPVKDVDWLGKWRVQKAIELARQLAKPTPEMVERVAVALFIEAGINSVNRPRTEADFWNQSDETQLRWQSASKAAIAAIFKDVHDTEVKRAREMLNDGDFVGVEASEAFIKSIINGPGRADS